MASPLSIYAAATFITGVLFAATLLVLIVAGLIQDNKNG